MKRGRIRPKRKGPPRRGRVVDPEYLAWVANQPGAVHGGRVYSVHHVRFCGSPKNDRRVLGLERGYHQIQEGRHSIEELGKENWQALHHIDIEATIARQNEQYLAEHPAIVW